MRRMAILVGILLWGVGLIYAASPITPENAAQVQMVGVLHDDTNRTQSLIFTPDGRQLFYSISSRDAGNQILALDFATLDETVAWENADVDANRLTFSPDGTRLAFYAGAELLLLTGDDLVTLYTASGTTDEVRSIAFSPDGVMLAAGRRDGSVLVVAVESGELLATLVTVDASADERTRLAEEVTQVLFSLDGTQILSAHESGWLRAWDAVTFEKLSEGQAHRRSIQDMAFSPDGVLLATAGKDNAVRVWQNGTPVYEWVATVSALDFNADGSLLAGGGKSLHLWNMTDGSVAFQNFHADKDVSAARVEFSPDGTFLAAGNRQLNFWAVSPLELALIPLEDDRVSAGEELYQRNGCNGCHFQYTSGAPSLYGLGETAATRIEGMSAEDYIYEAIVDPDAFIVKGFPRGIHPAYYGERLSAEEVWMMVAYIQSLEG